MNDFRHSLGACFVSIVGFMLLRCSTVGGGIVPRRTRRRTTTMEEDCKEANMDVNNVGFNFFLFNGGRKSMHVFIGLFLFTKKERKILRVPLTSKGNISFL